MEKKSIKSGEEELYLSEINTLQGVLGLSETLRVSERV